MGIAERKEREKHEMKRLIMDAARRLFIEQGFEKTSIRNIADAIEYSPGTIYLYYKDKSELLFDLHHESFQKLIEQFQRVLNIRDPFERLINMGRYYLEYGFENPELYELMFLMVSPIETIECREEIWVEGRAAFEMLRQIVKECIEAGYFEVDDVEGTSLMIWATVHGLVTIHLKKRSTMFEETERIPRLQHAYERFVELLKRKI
ncbi:MULTISPECIES: TetR/AcrR family transcriptional regulator [Emticicia]|uniref:TetR/AcrR family transcriptional regulator n=1 Tax=Emticicia TaxID=312278 RepID=UPI000C758916|nr:MULTISPECIES: TetR/AcrR family transcriptional regulator [Emticicia]PLK46316.1 TetR family transcriptional regulator [Emticicia sp. TH156]UTA68105.1 TetR/AcrR family transcriptional regulator [Emticicia sp. 21SJ11W-3]